MTGEVTASRRLADARPLIKARNTGAALRTGVRLRRPPRALRAQQLKYGRTGYRFCHSGLLVPPLREQWPVARGPMCARAAHVAVARAHCATRQLLFACLKRSCFRVAGWVQLTVRLPISSRRFFGESRTPRSEANLSTEPGNFFPCWRVFGVSLEGAKAWLPIPKTMTACCPA